MNTSFSFRFLENIKDNRQSLVVFCSSHINQDQVIKCIKEESEQLPIHNNVYLIALDEHKEDLKNLISNSSFINEFSAVSNVDASKLKGLTIDGFGDFLKIDSGIRCNNKVATSILQSGSLEIFKSRKGVITSSSSYHFEKPSGDHCNKFIRTSNLLISSAEVTFLALSLLPSLNPHISRIYIDTSSIAFLISTAVQLSANCDPRNVAIASFESYAVFNQSYDFIEDEKSLIVISATTSGSLVKKMMDTTVFPKNQYVTLFHVNLPNDQRGLFDVSSVIEGGITSVKPEKCQFCMRGAKLIKISGDQFLPETPKHELFVIRKSDFKDREYFFKEFATKNVLEWNKSPSKTAEYNELYYINVKNAIENIAESFRNSLKKLKKRYVAKDVNALISLGDEGSEALAEYLKDDLTVYSADKLSDEDVEIFNSVIVVAGAITSGRKLLSVSRKLRGLKDCSTITYFVGFSKLPTKDAVDQLKKDLEQGGHQFVLVRDCSMPRVKKDTFTAWDSETEHWKSFKSDDPMCLVEIEIPDYFSLRQAKLQNKDFTANDLFLTDPIGNPLKLRPTFAFWSGLDLDTEKASQADVFWAIQAVLHDLRIKSQDKGLATTYHITLISPVCFDRFNDGVIQAGLLRAAKPVELDYSIDENFSRQMTDIIISTLKNWDNAQGEGALEFLLALSSERMRLLKPHLREILDLLRDHQNELLRFFGSPVAD
jgi:hypothetical protein